MTEHHEALMRETVETYDQSAQALSEYFRGIGPRTEHIDKAFELAGNPTDAKVLEIGCGDGRDAAEIVKRAKWYIGFDISKSMVELAEQHVPEADFEVADAVHYNYPPDMGIVFAFASLLHLKNDEMGKVMSKVAGSLRVGGIFYLSLKHAPEYTPMIKEDEHGRRLFYLYSEDEIQSIAGVSGFFETASLEKEVKGNTTWLEMALMRIEKPAMGHVYARNFGSR